MRLPDPFTPNLKVDLLPEISEQPTIVSDYTTILSDRGIRTDLETYLKTRSPSTFPSDLVGKLLDRQDAQTEYPLELINAVVMFVGAKAVEQMQNKSQNVISVAQSAPMDVFEILIKEFDSEGRLRSINETKRLTEMPRSILHAERNR
jgi:CCR4-NOT transcription complex subunit 1